MSDDALRAAVLALNARYLEEFVEAFNVCPFAKRCRESGKLAREVFTQSEPDAAPLVAWARALAPTSAEVALAIFPRLTLGERALHRFCAAFSEAHAADQGGRAVFYAVTFHPDAKLDLATPDRLVPFLRRSPHRTIQLVRASLLDAVRGGDVGKRFATTFDAAKALPPESRVSAGIGEANLDTVHREGPAKLAALLDGLRVAAERMTDKS